MKLERIRLRRAADAADLTGLTTAKRTGDAYWDPAATDVLVMPLDPEPSPAQAKAIRRRLVTNDAADEKHLGELIAAHADSRAPAWVRLALASEIRQYGQVEDLA